MAVTVQGPWRVRVTEKNAAWAQRFIISGSDASDNIYPGSVGTRVEAGGMSWTIQAQHSADGGPWQDNDMRIGSETPSGISVIRVIETDDRGAQPPDFNDLVMEIRKKQDPILAVMQRPYAINPRTLMMNPDGVFLANGGVQVMAVRVRNTWTQAMPADQVLDISPASRAQLAAVGIQVVDTWSASELEWFGQSMVGPTRMPIIGPLPVDGERTVYFKLDCSAARTSTTQVEFLCRRPFAEPDLDDPARLARRKIFVTQVRYNPVTREVVGEAPEGSLRLELQKLTLDPRQWNEMRDCIRRAAGGPRGPRLRELRERLARTLKDLETGRCDPCTLQDLVLLFCECIGEDGGHDGGDGRPGGQGGINPCPFPWLPLRFSYTVEAPFEGQYGPLPFQDPWWKILALIIAILLLIAAALVDILDEAHENPEIVIGTVDRFSTANVDCALVALNGTRGFDLGVLDVQTGEPNTNARIATGAVVPIVRSVAAPFIGMRVYKSGARTGLTHGIVTSLSAPVNQCRGEFEDATGVCTPDPDRPNLMMTNQLRIGTSTDFPTEPTTDNGDSGSLWLSDEPATRDQVVGLTHSGGTGSSAANPIGDVLAALNVRLNP
jgi:hypothetical protein